MNQDLLFSLVNSIALFGWIILLIFPYNKRVKAILSGIVITFLSVLYTVIIFQSLQPESLDNFNSLDGLTTLFSNKTALLAGWIHYLAFDLMTGLYIAKNAEKYGINRIILSICLLFTFMLGPFGLLLYLFTRMIRNKRYFHSY